MRHLLAALAVLATTSTLARAEAPGYEGLDIHALLDSLTDEQREEYHIAIARWQTATPPQWPVDHAYILGSLEGVAKYNDADSTTITTGLTIFPTTYLLRIPASWNGRVLVAMHPAGYLGMNPFH